MPEMHLVSTVLPAPLSPHNAVTLPEGSSRLTWKRAWTGPKCLSRATTFSSGSEVAFVIATSELMSGELSPSTKSDAAARCGGVDRKLGYEMPAAVHTAAPAWAHRAAGSMALSLMTVASMLAMLTQ